MFKQALEPGEQTAFKVVVVNGTANDYAIYYGPIDWTDDEIRSSGGKFDTETAKRLAFALPALGHQWYNLEPRA